MRKLASLFAGLAGLALHPRETFWSARRLYWSRRVRPQVPAVESVGNRTADMKAYSAFEVPTLLCPWDTPIHDLFWLVELLKAAQPRRIMEFGTCTGLATYYLAKNSAPDAVVTTLDLPDEDFERIKPSPEITLGMRFKGTPEESKIRRVPVDLACLDTSRFEPQDFIFIDAQHGYEDALRDSENALRMLAPGGTIVWHDYDVEESCAGVVRALNDLERKLHGIKRLKGTTLAFYRKP